MRKYRFGKPFNTEAVIVDMVEETEVFPVGEISTKQGFHFTYIMADEDIVYGLGEANRGINKRGFHYISNCDDNPNHTEDVLSLYGAHNFIVIDGEKKFGLFVDYPGILEFDVGYTRQDTLHIFCKTSDLDLYLIEGESAYDIVKQFLQAIGQSYIPPKFAFGYGQSRWGYRTAEDFREVVKKHREAKIPLDMVYMDIDYMDHYKDFTINEKEYPDFPAFVEEMKKEKIHLIPIIDAGVKIEENYSVYEEGREKGFFCKNRDGSDFEAAVWPGLTHLPDVLNPEARAWFGEKYRGLIEAGIDGFWNDMNEPAIFYTPRGVDRLRAFYNEKVKEGREIPFFELCDEVNGLSNSDLDYGDFYHNVGGKMVCHRDVHNLFGYNMTRAASEAFEKICPNKKILMFSRSSYIGMHRYGGIWMGDNRSWWSHLLLNLKMLPSLNMCGFLYIGTDLGGFGGNTTRDLLLRFLALGVFMPLMRNHSSDGTRFQEVYRFEKTEDFKHIIEVRYRLVPYIYSEYMKAAKGMDMLFKPLGFVYEKDERAKKTEDQLMFGNEIMIAPVYTQNADGRYVYLPEEMMFVKFLPDGNIKKEILPKGHHFVEIALNEVPLFIRKDKCIPLAKPAETVEEIDESTITMLGYENSSYKRYDFS